MCPSAIVPASIDVLIVEDDPIIRLSVRRLLEDEGYTCAESEDGRGVLDIALACSPRLILLDLTMPEVAVSAIDAIAVKLAELRRN